MTKDLAMARMSSEAWNSGLRRLQAPHQDLWISIITGRFFSLAEASPAGKSLYQSIKSPNPRACPWGPAKAKPTDSTTNNRTIALFMMIFLCDKMREAEQTPKSNQNNKKMMT